MEKNGKIKKLTRDRKIKLLIKEKQIREQFKEIQRKNNEYWKRKFDKD